MAQNQNGYQGSGARPNITGVDSLGRVVRSGNGTNVKESGRSVSGNRNNAVNDLTMASQMVSCPLGDRCPHPESQHTSGSKSMIEHSRIASRIEKRGGKMKVSLDLDGTVAGFAQKSHEVAKRLGYDVSDEFQHPTKYSMIEEGWLQRKEQLSSVIKEIYASGDLEHLPVLENNLSATIERLQDNGIEIHVVTARVIDGFGDSINKTVQESTRAWIAKHVPSADSINIVKSGSKHKVGADLYIEDSPSEIQNLEGNPIVIRNQRYNQDNNVPTEGRRRTNNIRDIFGGFFG